MCAAVAGAAVDEFTWDDKGRVRKGPYLLFSDRKGGLYLLCRGKPVFERMGFGCGLNGFTSYEKLRDVKLVRKKGEISFEGKFPGVDVTYRHKVTTDGTRLKIEIERSGAWPKKAGWCNVQIQLPRARIGRGDFTVNGEKRSYPEKCPEDGSLDWNVKKLEIHAKDPANSITIESEGNMGIQDARKWGGTHYQIVFGFADENRVKFTAYITLPENAGGGGPALRLSQIGYPIKGEKCVVMEWPQGTKRPDDWVRIETAFGKVVKKGKFGETVDFMGTSAASFDFSEVKDEGVYMARWSGGASPQFRIGGVFHKKLWEPTLGVWIPWQMCHGDVDLKGAAPAHPASHMDDGIRVPANYPEIDGFRSYECEGIPYKAGERILCAKGGWYDAGDYDLNVSAQGFTVWQLALAYEEFGIEIDNATLDTEAQTFRVGKPDKMPDILQQVEWGAHWLLSMQQKDGRVYVGVCAAPERYGARVVPEKSSDGKPGTGDERHVYVDYHSDHQLKAVISFAAAGRVLRKHRPKLAAKCLEASRKGFEYFRKNKQVYRTTVYAPYNGKPKGTEGMTVAAAIELYLTTKDKTYLTVVEEMEPVIAKMKMNWPEPSRTGQYGIWFGGPFFARLIPVLEDGGLKKTLVAACERAATDNLQMRMKPRPWPFHVWSFSDWGNVGTVLGRIFDTYYLSKVVPDRIKMKDVLPTAYWLFGLHPINDYAYACDVGCPSAKHLYSGQLHSRKDAPLSVPGAVIPGIGALPDAGILIYLDEPGRYRYNEACIYSAATYIFAVNALSKWEKGE